MDNFLCIFRPCILKAEKKVGFVSIEESFDTTFNMGYRWEGESSPPPVLMVPDNAGPEIKNFNFYMIQKGVSGRAGHPDVTKYQ